MHLFQDLPLVVRVLCLTHAVPHGHERAVHVLEEGPNPVADRLFDLPLDQTGGEGPERLVQEVVLRLPDSKLERVDFYVDAVDLEDRGWIVRRGDEFNGGLCIFQM